MKKLYVSILGLLFTISFFAQTPVTGKVLDANSQAPLEGAKIEINNKITTSDKAGKFTFNCQPGTTIKASYLGYEQNTILISNCSSTITIFMKPSSNNLDEVQVTGIINTTQKSLRNPASVVELKQKELKRGTGLYLDDAINANIPGVIMERRAVSSGQQFNIRGYGNGIGFKGANNNFDGQGYKVYLNNIPITDAEGITLLDDIDFSSIGNVDVIKGPAGTKYGLAIAGVVNLETIRPQAGKTSISQSVTAGKYGLLRLTSQFQTGGEKSSLLLNYGHQISDGYMVHTHSKKDFLNLIMDYSPNDKEYINTYFGYSNSYDERGGELSIEQYENKDYSGNSRYIKNNAHSEIISFRAGLSHTYLFTNWLKNTTTVFGTGVTNNSSSAGGWTDKNPVNYGLRSVFDLNFNLSDAVSLTGETGVELQKQRAQIIGYRMTENPNDPEGYNIIGNFKSNQYAESGTSSVFTEWVLHLPSDFSVTARIGLSRMNIDLEDRLYDPENTNARTVNADYNGMYSPHLAVNKVFNNNVSVYASYSTGYKAPVSSNIVLSTSGKLNTGLVPERGDQFEIGSKGNLFSNKLYYQVALFDAVFKDKFTSVAVPLDANTTAYSYIANGGKQDNKGVEILLKYNAYTAVSGFLNSIDPYANITYSHFRYKNYQYESLDGDGNKVNADYTGKAVAGVAPWMVNTGVDVTTNVGFYGNVNYSYRDAMPFTSDGQNRTSAYNLLNAKLGYKTGFGHFDLDVFAGADNITGTQYYYMVFVNQLPDAYLPAPYDANFYGGMSLRYNF